jgi:2-oxoglutarate ferredoxin oxidoreductase subunit alpha
MVAEANTLAFKAGGTSARPPSCSSPPTRSSRPTCRRAYTNISGNTALAWGLIAAGSWPSCRSSSAVTRSPRRRTSSTSCPSTRTSACAPSRPRTRSPGRRRPRRRLRRLARRHHDQRPGFDLKAETIGLAVSLELPLLIIDIQRGGPSTGLPTKTEQADLLQAMFGRHGEAPLPDRRPLHARRLLLRRHRSGPHRPQVPDPGDPALRRLPGQWSRAVADPRRGGAPRHQRSFATEPNQGPPDGTEEFWPYLRDPETWPAPGPFPGTPGLMHRIGGSKRPTARAISPTTP